MLINTSILPGEGVDVLVLELSMLGELLVIVDAPMVILVEERGERKIGRQILDCSEERLRPNLRSRPFNGSSQGISVVGGVQIRGLCDQGVNALNNLVGKTRRRERLLVASKPDVVGDSSQALVASVDVENSTKLVLEVVSATGLKTNPVKIEPRAPKASGQEVDVTVDKTTSVVSEGKINLVLDIEVNHSHDALGREKRNHRVND
jgi:hypothetical protein